MLFSSNILIVYRISEWSVLIWWLYDSSIKYDRNFFIQANQIQPVGMKNIAYFMQNVMFTYKRLEKKLRYTLLLF